MLQRLTPEAVDAARRLTGNDDIAIDGTVRGITSRLIFATLGRRGAQKIRNMVLGGLIARCP